MKCLGVGEIRVRNEYGENFVMSDVSFIPDLSQNILAVNVIRKNGFDVNIGRDIKFIDRVTEKKVTEVEELGNGLLRVEFLVEFTKNDISRALNEEVEVDGVGSVNEGADIDDENVASEIDTNEELKYLNVESKVRMITMKVF